MIIALLGKKGAGKDTAGAVLAKELNGTCLAFADPMKRFCMKALGLTERQLWGSLKDKEKPISKAQLKAFAPMFQVEFHRIVYALNDVLDEQRNVYTELKHATPMSEWLKARREEKKALTPRRVLQTFGTELGRQHLGDDVWVNLGLKTARKILDGWAYDRVQGLAKRHGGSDAAVITDCRFRNEVLAVKRAGGKVVRIVRVDDSSDIHPSEAEQDSIPDWWCDAVIYNTRSKVEFEAEVKLVAQHLKANSWVYGERP